MKPLQRIPNTSEAYTGSTPEGKQFLFEKETQYRTADGNILVAVHWRGHLLLWDTEEDRPRPISVYRDEPLEILGEADQLDLSEKYLHKRMFERERAMGRRIYG